MGRPCLHSGDHPPFLLKWDWVVSVTLRLFKRLPGETRLNHAWDHLNFILITTVIVSGIVISQKAMPLFGIPINRDPFWITVHGLSTALLLAIIGVHIGLHWTWVVNTANRYLFKRSRANWPQADGGERLAMPTLKNAVIATLVVLLAAAVLAALLGGCRNPAWRKPCVTTWGQRRQIHYRPPPLPQRHQPQRRTSPDSASWFHS